MVAIATTCTVRIHGKSRSEAILIPVAFITTSDFPWPLLPCTAGGNIIFRGSCYHRRWQYHFLWPLLPPLVAISFSVALVTTAGGNIIFCGPYYHRWWQYHFSWLLLPPPVAISPSVALITTPGGNIISAASN